MKTTCLNSLYNRVIPTYIKPYNISGLQMSYVNSFFYLFVVKNVISGVKIKTGNVANNFKRNYILGKIQN